MRTQSNAAARNTTLGGERRRRALACEIAEWRWSFHDGTLGEGRVVTHSWSKAGVYPVILQVVDDQGGRDDVSIKVTIEAPAAREEESGCATSGALPFALLGLVRRRRR